MINKCFIYGSILFHKELLEAKKTTAKETQTDEDDYLLPISLRDSQNVASDEYVRVNIERESQGNDVAPVTENTGKNILLL